MAIVETFSRRQKKLRGEEVDVFSYDFIPPALRVQIVGIWDEALGTAYASVAGTRSESAVYKELHRISAKELGLFSLGDTYQSYDREVLVKFFAEQASTEQALDIIDLSFRFILFMHKKRSDWAGLFKVTATAGEAISDLNERFLQHGVGYAFVHDGLIRKDNEHLHQESILPALRVLHEQGFEGANEEYRLAHDHYRHGQYKDCLNNCLKAFESTMKTICTSRGWTYQSTDTASTLIKVCIENGLFPSFLEAHFGVIQSLLTSGIPTVRNKMGGHGQGPDALPAPAYFAEYLLHETATTIVFLVGSFKALS